MRFLLVTLLTLSISACCNREAPPQNSELKPDSSNTQLATEQGTFDIDTESPKTPNGITEEAGYEQAKSDIASGKVRIMLAGTITSTAPGIKLDDSRFKRIPIHTLPSGCSVPNAANWYLFAKGYNKAISEHIEAGSTPPNA